MSLHASYEVKSIAQGPENFFDVNFSIFSDTLVAILRAHDFAELSSLSHVVTGRCV